ncbi:MAG: hypothetical protein Q8M07_01875 [Prosthecobacter sp.]|nr:hypothetical protein [Prosthecobacter sp.]
MQRFTRLAVIVLALGVAGTAHAFKSRYGSAADYTTEAADAKLDERDRCRSTVRTIVREALDVGCAAYAEAPEIEEQCRAKVTKEGKNQLAECREAYTTWKESRAAFEREQQEMQSELPEGTTLNEAIAESEQCNAWAEEAKAQELAQCEEIDDTLRRMNCEDRARGAYSSSQNRCLYQFEKLSERSLVKRRAQNAHKSAEAVAPAPLSRPPAQRATPAPSFVCTAWSCPLATPAPSPVCTAWSCP